MTATVQFLTSTATNVLAVPNAALRLRPTTDMLAAVGMTASGRPAGDSTARGTAVTPADSAQRRAPAAASAGGNGRAGGAGGAGGAGRANAAGGARGANAWGGAGHAASALLWTVDSTGTLHAVRVHTGLSDGQNTQVDGKGLTDGMQVITSLGAAAGAAPAAPAASSPFQAQRRGRGF
jgi:hypothetical protein